MIRIVQRHLQRALLLGSTLGAVAILSIGCDGSSTGSGASAQGGGIGTSGGGAAQGGSSGASQFCTPNTILDDMEDGDGAICQNNNARRGGWYTEKGANGTMSPAPQTVLNATLIPGGGRGTSRNAMHATGSGFVTTAPNDNWALLGVSLNDVAVQDVTQFTGLRFWALSQGGSLRMRANFTTTASRSQDIGGTCIAQAGLQCNDHWGEWVDLTGSWQQYSVNFDFVSQSGWGTVTAKDLAHVWTIEFNYLPTPLGSTMPNPTSFDFWIDDVEFW